MRDYAVAGSWTMLNQYERMKNFGTSSADFANGKMNIPENANGVNDLLIDGRLPPKHPQLVGPPIFDWLG